LADIDRDGPIIVRGEDDRTPATGSHQKLGMVDSVNPPVARADVERAPVVVVSDPLAVHRGSVQANQDE
jgi:hypothetical protein